MNLFEHFRIIWRRRFVVLGVALAAAILTFIAFKLQAEVFEATAEMSVTPGQTSASSSPGTDAVFLAATYAQLGTTEPVVSAAVKASGLHLSEGEAAARLSVSASSTLGVVTVTAKGPSSHEATVLAQAEVGALTDAVTSQQEQAITTQIAKVSAQITALNAQIGAEPAGSPQIALLQAQVQALQQVGAAQQSQPLNQVAVLAPAHGTGGAISPRPTRDALLAFITALVLAAEATVVIEAASDRFPRDRIEEEVTKATGLAVLAQVPEGEASVVEAFRKLRTSLQFMDDADGTRTVAVASTDAGAGKSFVAINLAKAVGEAGQPVVLIDGDTRRPVVHERLRLAGAPGLTDVLRGAPVLRTLQELPRRQQVLVLSAGEQVADPSGLFSRMFVSRVVRPLSEDRVSADGLIVVDTPPESLFPDVLTIAAQCDATIIVIDARRARRRAVKRTVEQLRQVGANPLGVVLNRSTNVLPGGTQYGRYDRSITDSPVEAPRPERRVKKVVPDR